MCSPNRYQFSRKVCLFAEQIQIFQEDLVCLPNSYHFFRRPLYVFIEQIPIFQEHLFICRTDTDFPGTLFMCSPNRYQFSRSTSFLATEQITIFQEAWKSRWLLSGYDFINLPSAHKVCTHRRFNVHTIRRSNVMDAVCAQGRFPFHNIILNRKIVKETR